MGLNETGCDVQGLRAGGGGSDDGGDNGDGDNNDNDDDVVAMFCIWPPPYIDL